MASDSKVFTFIHVASWQDKRAAPHTSVPDHSSIRPNSGKKDGGSRKSRETTVWGENWVLAGKLLAHLSVGLIRNQQSWRWGERAQKGEGSIFLSLAVLSLSFVLSGRYFSLRWVLCWALFSTVGKIKNPLLLTAKRELSDKEGERARPAGLVLFCSGNSWIL